MVWDVKSKQTAGCTATSLIQKAHGTPCVPVKQDIHHWWFHQPYLCAAPTFSPSMCSSNIEALTRTNHKHRAHCTQEDTMILSFIYLTLTISPQEVFYLLVKMWGNESDQQPEKLTLPRHILKMWNRTVNLIPGSAPARNLEKWNWTFKSHWRQAV